MAKEASANKRRTTTDELFDALYTDIIKMRLPPGTKLSESEVASQYDVSRQPVREALIRLNDLDLVAVRPQRVTIVRPMSRSTIVQARFVRLAVELETGRRAGENFNPEHEKGLKELLALQKNALEAGDVGKFNLLDHQFHMRICEIAGCDFAIKIIEDCKATVDRLCMLSLTDKNGAKQILADHKKIVTGLSKRDPEAVKQAIMLHMARLDDTIAEVQQSHAEYFSD